MKIGVSLSEKRNENENETHWRMKMNASARQVHCELPPERISGVSQNRVYLQHLSNFCYHSSFLSEDSD
jgi:hypothetical protein